MIIRKAIMKEKNPPIPKKYPIVTPFVRPRCFTAFKNACAQHHSTMKHPAMVISSFITNSPKKAVANIIAINASVVAEYPMIACITLNALLLQRKYF